jgi:hypothetical protein
MKLYQTRMPIEEAFWDIKNPRWGFGMRYSHPCAIERKAYLLLIGTLATLAVGLVGKAACQRKLYYQFQANTVRSRTVLSLFFLGCQSLKRSGIRITQPEL